MSLNLAPETYSDIKVSPGSSGPSCRLALHKAGPAPSLLLPQLNKCITVIRVTKCRWVNTVCFCSAGEKTQLYDRKQEVGTGARPEGAAIAEADVSGGRSTTEDVFCLSSNSSLLGRARRYQELKRGQNMWRTTPGIEKRPLAHNAQPNRGSLAICAPDVSLMIHRFYRQNTKSLSLKHPFTSGVC